MASLHESAIISWIQLHKSPIALYRIKKATPPPVGVFELIKQ
jgi:hypothetical protein